MRTNFRRISLAEIAQHVAGRVDGDAQFEVTRLGSLENAAADSLAFCVAPAMHHQLSHTNAGAVLLRAEHAALFPRHKLIVADPYLAYAQISRLFAPPPQRDGVHPSAIIAASAQVHPTASVGAYAVIGERVVLGAQVILGSQVSVGDESSVGQDTHIDPGVRIGARSHIGARCRISSGVVIGASGFGYAEQNGTWQRIEQLGGVRIGDDVDIGANTTVDRAAIDETVLEDGVKLDNHIQIAHNVRVGAHTIMANGVAVAGSTQIGKNCRIGGCAKFVGHIRIADGVTINGASVVTKSITEPGAYSSILPARPAAQWNKTLARINRLK